MSEEYKQLIANLSYRNLTITENGILVWDTDDTEQDEQFTNRCQLHDDLKELGWELEEVESDHDTIQGKLVKIKK